MFLAPEAHSGSSVFFQAEDGIRDLTVTGVQTCALPISPGLPRCRPTNRPPRPSQVAGAPPSSLWASSCSAWRRSEERRVGKECRSRWSRYHSKKNGLNGLDQRLARVGVSVVHGYRTAVD